MQKLGKRLYVGGYLLPSLGQFVFSSLAMVLAAVYPEKHILPTLLQIPGSLLAVLAFVVTCILVYRMWSSIQGLGARTTPGLALGLLFVPLFNFFWYFVVLWGWTKDYNKLRSQYAAQLPRMPEGIALTICILPIAEMLSFIVVLILHGLPQMGESLTSNPGMIASLVLGLISTLLMAVLYSNVCDGVNALVEAGIEPQSPETLQPSGEAKNSGMAIASLVLGLCGYCTAGLTGLIGLILGIIGLKNIAASHGALKGKGLAIAGIAVSGFSLFTMAIMIAILIPALTSVKHLARNMVEITNAKNAALFMTLYAADNDDALPVDTWPQALEPYMQDNPDILTSPTDPAAGRAFAMNAKLNGLKTTDVSPDTVMLFECEFASPPAGGPELLPKQPRSLTGYTIAFVDGQAETVAPDKVEDLRWEP